MFASGPAAVRKHGFNGSEALPPVPDVSLRRCARFTAFRTPPRPGPHRVAAAAGSAQPVSGRSAGSLGRGPQQAFFPVGRKGKGVGPAGLDGPVRTKVFYFQ